MLRPELIDSLRAATPSAPAQLRARVRALEPAPARRRVTARRLKVVLSVAFVCAAAAVALVALPTSRGPSLRFPGAHGEVTAKQPLYSPPALVNGSGSVSASAARGSLSVTSVPPSTTRLQRYGATLHLRLASGPAVATATRQAVTLVERLGGFEQSTRVSVTAKAGSAVLVLRVPRAAVTTAIARLSRLGLVIGEQLSITDLQSGVDTIGVHIEQLERTLAAALRAPQTPQSQRLVASLTAEIVSLQRTRAATRRGAADATISLDLSTPARAHPPKRNRAHGPFHALGVAFRDVGIGAIYLLALGTPLALLIGLCVVGSRRVRRRRDERLLSRS